MDIQKIKQLIRVVEKSDISELEVEEEGHKIRISKLTNSPNMGQNQNGLLNPVFVQTPVSQPLAETPSAETKSLESAPLDKGKFFEVRSPMVGTFYRAPSPEADPFVKMGDSVSPGSTLCLIEAMKLMNNIESEINGKIVEILVDNAQPVEYNQILMIIEK